jgi:hypothetical protein
MAKGTSRTANGKAVQKTVTKRKARAGASASDKYAREAAALRARDLGVMVRDVANETDAAMLGAILRISLDQAASAAHAFADAVHYAPAEWPDAATDAMGLAIILTETLDLAKALSLRAVVAGAEDPAIARGRAMVGALRPLLRPDGVKGGQKRPAIIGAPITSADLRRDLTRCAVFASLTMPWEAGDPEHVGDIDKHLRAVHANRKLPERDAMAWMRADLDRLVPKLEVLLRRHGHLLGKPPASDLRARLLAEVESVRQRSVRTERHPENFVRAVLRAYGLSQAEAKSVTRGK